MAKRLIGASFATALLASQAMGSFATAANAQPQDPLNELTVENAQMCVANFKAGKNIVTLPLKSRSIKIAQIGDMFCYQEKDVAAFGLIDSQNHIVASADAVNVTAIITLKSFMHVQLRGEDGQMRRTTIDNTNKPLDENSFLKGMSPKDRDHYQRAIGIAAYLQNLIR